MKKLFIGLTLLASISSSFAKDVNFPAVIATNMGADMIRFEKCLNVNSCKIIGKPYGYELSELNFSPKLRKTRAIGTGVVEGVAAVGAVTITWLTAGLGPLGVQATIAGLGLGGVAVSGKLVDALNPALQYEMANVESTIQQDLFGNNDFIAIEFENEKKMNDYTKTLKKVLSNIDN